MLDVVVNVLVPEGVGTEVLPLSTVLVAVWDGVTVALLMAVP